MTEPSLLEASTDRTAQVYRFTYLRTWDDPLAVRLTVNADGTGSVESSILRRGCTDCFGRSNQREISADRVQDFLRLLNVADFWSLPTKGDRRGKDGAEWILEGVENGHYQVVTRWSPQPSAYRRVCERLLKTSQLKLALAQTY